MNREIHPEVFDTTVSCACGKRFETKSVKQRIEVDICSGCHPLFTGQQKFVDRAGRIEKFKERYAAKPEKKAAKKAVKVPAKGKKKA